VISRAEYFKSFLGLFGRDLRVMRRELLPFVLRVGMQPLLFIFVFTAVLPRMAGGNPMGGINYGQIILPGLMAVGIMFTGIAAVALPLSTEFGITREIDDRVMSPVPLWLVGFEKLFFSSLQCILAAALVIPMAYYIPATPVKPEISNWFLFIFVLIVSSFLASSLGLVIGSNVNPKQIGLVFSIVLVPITFLGCVYYPWVPIQLPALKYGVLINPIVYISEALRASVTPQVPSMHWWITCPALLVFTYLLGWWGIRSFTRRVIS
jgi:ABC-2 type transport system permease protein